MTNNHKSIMWQKLTYTIRLNLFPRTIAKWITLSKQNKHLEGNGILDCDEQFLINKTGISVLRECMENLVQFLSVIVRNLEINWIYT